MRHQTKEFIEKFLTEKAKAEPFTRVLDVGSMDVTGSIKELFVKSEYIGLDMREGTNVDVVMDAHDMTYKDEFDLIICVDTFEHDNAFWLTCEKIYQALKPGGWVIYGAPGRNCPDHKHPQDYWRFMEDSFKEILLKPYQNIHWEVEKNGDIEDELYGYGQKA